VDEVKPGSGEEGSGPGCWLVPFSGLGQVTGPLVSD